ncbi:MAG: AAA family ATPase [Patescibacteria group bacterium]|nr:AAA family ATPase [Patescibacteria group bacterium]MBU1876877.1 AAA family ATPase [Patescibacteria group bacterium]
MSKISCIKKIVGLTGEMGAGKDVFCQYVQKISNMPLFCFKFSDSLSEVLKIFFNDVTREDQQWLGINLRERFGKDILAKAIKKKIDSVNEGLIILNGIRYIEEFDMIKEVGGDVIYITADSKTRWQRLQTREEKKDDNVSYEKFLELDKASTEILIPEMGKTADYKIENSGSLDDFYKKIDSVLAKINEN